MKCNKCTFMVKREEISLMSQMMGFTAECSKTGTLFNPEKIIDTPLWCPLEKIQKEKLIKKLDA